MPAAMFDSTGYLAVITGPPRNVYMYLVPGSPTSHASGGGFCHVNSALVGGPVFGPLAQGR